MITQTTSKPKRKRSSVSQGTSQDRFGQVQKLTVKDCLRHLYNRHPKQRDVDERAASIKQHGQLEPILVRQIGKQFQILSGETRLLAHKKLKRTEIDGRIGYDIDDAAALELVAAANGSRTDLDPMQRAELLEHLTKPVADGGSGLTQEQAGQAVVADGAAMSRTAVSNAIRLLKLPPTIRQAISDGRLPETFAREVIGWFDGCQSEKSRGIVAAAILKECKSDDRDKMASRVDWVSYVRRMVKDKTRTLKFEKDPGDWQLRNNPTCTWAGAYFKPTAEQLEELDLISLGKEKLATNTKLWGKLQKAAAKEILARPSKSKGGSKGKPAKLTAAQQRAKEEAAKAKLQTKIRDWRILWMRHWLANELTLATAPAWRLLIKVNQGGGWLDCEEAMFSAADSLGVKCQVSIDSWDVMAGLMPRVATDDHDADAFAVAWAQEILWPREFENLFSIDDDIVESLAKEHGFKPAMAWIELIDDKSDSATDLIAKFYSIFSKSDLANLAIEISMGDDADVKAAKSKGDLVIAMSALTCSVPEVLK